MTNYQSKMDLTADLKKFGLNPKDWTLIKEQPGHYRIANKKDDSFRLKGQTKLLKQRLTWDSIHLFSI